MSEVDDLLDELAFEKDQCKGFVEELEALEGKILELARFIEAKPSRQCSSRPLPEGCRDRLQMEGKPYPRSGCMHCGSGMKGCPYKHGGSHG